MLAGTALAELKAKLESDLSSICRDDPVDAVIARLDALPAAVSLEEPRLIVTDVADRIALRHGADMAGKYCKLVVLTLFARFPDRVARVRFPPEVADYYARAEAIAIDTARTMADTEYRANPNFLLKDLRLASQLSLPCGAQAVDFRAWLPPSFYRNNGLRDNLGALWFVATNLGGMGPLFRIHTDTRDLSEFNEQGWTDCYRRIAALLKLYPEVRGVVGTSWFFDPALDRVSPHLSYLRKIPVHNGAYLRRDGESDGNTALALAKSQTRQKFHAEGKYTPCCFTVVWARRDLLRWAEGPASP